MVCVFLWRLEAYFDDLELNFNHFTRCTAAKNIFIFIFSCIHTQLTMSTFKNEQVKKSIKILKLINIFLGFMYKRGYMYVYEIFLSIEYLKISIN